MVAMAGLYLVVVLGGMRACDDGGISWWSSLEVEKEKG